MTILGRQGCEGRQGAITHKLPGLEILREFHNAPADQRVLDVLQMKMHIGEHEVDSILPGGSRLRSKREGREYLTMRP